MLTLRFKVFVVLILVLAVVSFALIQAMGRDLDRARQLVESRGQTFSRLALQENISAYREPFLREVVELWLKELDSENPPGNDLSDQEWPEFFSSVLELPMGGAASSRVLKNRDGLITQSIPSSEIALAGVAMRSQQIQVRDRVVLVPWPFKDPNHPPDRVLRLELEVADPTLPPFEIVQTDLRELRDSVTLTLLIGASLIIVVVIGLLRFLVLQPLDRLVKASKRVAKGDFSQVVDGGESRDEVGRLVGAFNTMQHEVRSYQREMAARIEAAKEEIRDQERSLVVAQRLAATGTLAAGLAHEINNPLGAMQNAARRLKKNAAGDDRAVEYLELIEEGLERIRHLMSQILDFSRRRDSKAEAFEIRQVLESSAAFVRHRFDDQYRLEVEIPEGMPQLYGNPASLGQVFINLMLNARDALKPQGGTVRLSVRALETNEVEIAVSDDGKGMDDETVNHIFDPFYTTKDVGKGTGLGLSIVHTVVRNHDGIISVESTKDNGTAFTVALPTSKPLQPSDE